MCKCSLVDNFGITDLNRAGAICWTVQTKVIVSDILSQHKHSARGEDAITAGNSLQPPHPLTSFMIMIIIKVG
jgi:hypothetical protein